jgi:ATP-dependent 26S proteasome regulatory subunit
MLHFPMPDESMRESIWRGIFPAKAPVEDLDFALLAKHLELSGASIKNCALHAAYMAAAGGTKISMEYILAGAKNEYDKMGRNISAQIFAGLLQEVTL